MKTNEHTSNVISLPEINNLQELVKDCNRAVVTYGLKEQTGKPNQYKKCKMVVLYSDDLEMETIVRASSITMMKNDVSICKPFIYRIMDSIVSISKFDFYAALFRPIFGFTPNQNVHDNTRTYNEYRKGGRYDQI